MRLVVIPELPRTRDTLLLRLMGKGRTLVEAIIDLRALPLDAPERGWALPTLIELRLTNRPPEGVTSEDEEVLRAMTTGIYEAWEAKLLAQGRDEGRETGREEGLRLAITSVYEARFGALPSEVARTVEAAHELGTLIAWSRLVATASEQDVRAALTGRT